MPNSMDHNEFMIDEDLIDPIKAFMRKIEMREKQKQKMMNDLKTLEKDKEGGLVHKNMLGLGGFGHLNRDP